MIIAFMAAVCACQSSPGQQQFGGWGLMRIDSVLAVAPGIRAERVPFPIDPIQMQMVEGTFKSPAAGSGGWRAVTADNNGKFAGPEFDGGYSFFTYKSDSERTVLLDISGDSMAYVNGCPFAGDPYGYGYVRLPIHLKRGENDFLIQNGRGELEVSLDPPRKPVSLDTSDLTMPDAVVGTKTNDHFGGVVIVNSTDEPTPRIVIEASLPGAKTAVTPAPGIPPMSTLKVPFDIPDKVWEKPGETGIRLVLRNPAGWAIDEAQVKMRIRTPTQTRKETYISSVDGSVQYYAVVPPPHPRPGLAMMLSLHGAGVEAIGQADAYSPKDWAHVVCPTNRRPFGFDWEAWGREDGIDVLDIAKQEYQTNPSRTYVTGHSMGGHGTWQFGALFPDKWAAIAVSAGWCSFYTYVSGGLAEHPDSMSSLFYRAAATSNTPDLEHNYSSNGVYILHGDADDNVPITEARNMKAMLAPIVPDLGYHEQPGAGHWWSTALTKGATCLEYPPMMDFLKSHLIRPRTSIDFTTVDLAASNSYEDVRVLRQTHPLLPSRIKISCGAAETSNIDAFFLPPMWNDDIVGVDGQPVHSGSGYFLREGGSWEASPPIPVGQVGPFHRAFNNHAVLVYGTEGSEEENRWAYDKARFDSESFWYRGNGSLQVVSDREYLRNRSKFGNAILYGNSETNAAWNNVFDRAPIQVGKGWVRVGPRLFQRPDLAVIFCWRKPGDKCINAAICGTGPVGARLAERLPIFLSGVAYPDWTIDSPDSLDKGTAGVVGAGYFGPEGNFDSEESVINGIR